MTNGPGCQRHKGRLTTRRSAVGCTPDHRVRSASARFNWTNPAAGADPAGTVRPLISGDQIGPRPVCDLRIGVAIAEQNDHILGIGLSLGHQRRDDHFRVEGLDAADGLGARTARGCPLYRWHQVRTGIQRARSGQPVIGTERNDLIGRSGLADVGMQRISRACGHASRLRARHPTRQFRLRYTRIIESLYAATA